MDLLGQSGGFTVANYLANVRLLLSESGLQAGLAALQAEALLQQRLMMTRVISTQENCGLIEVRKLVGGMSTPGLTVAAVVQPTRVIRWPRQA